jgi:hypothetical protein
MRSVRWSRTSKVMRQRHWPYDRRTARKRARSCSPALIGQSGWPDDRRIPWARSVGGHSASQTGATGGGPRPAALGTIGP